MSSDRTFKKLKKNKLKTHFKGFSKSHVLTPSFAKLRYPPLYGVYPLYTSFTISKIITGQGGDSSFIRLAADSFGMTVHFVMTGGRGGDSQTYICSQSKFSVNRHLCPYVPHIQLVIPNEVRNLHPIPQIILN